MNQRKDSYRAAIRRDQATPRTSGGIVIRTKPVCVTIDLAPGLHRELRRRASDIAAEFAVAGTALAGVVRVLTHHVARIRRVR